MTDSQKPGKKNATEESALLRGPALLRELDRKCKGLVYISEVDSPVEVFEGTGLSDEMLKKLHKSLKKRKQTRLAKLKERLTRIDDGYSKSRNENAARFSRVFAVLERNLRNLGIHREGKVSIDIFIYGLDLDEAIIGVRTRALET